MPDSSCSHRRRAGEGVVARTWLGEPTHRSALQELPSHAVQSLDFGRMTTLTPWLQRRLGWGGARTTPELLEALQKEARLRLAAPLHSG